MLSTLYIFITCLLASDRFCSYREDKPEFWTMGGKDVSETFLVTLGVCEVFASVLRDNGVRSTRCPYEDLEVGHVYSWSCDPTLVGDLNTAVQDVVNQAELAKPILKENNIW